MICTYCTILWNLLYVLWQTTTAPFSSTSLWNRVSYWRKAARTPASEIFPMTSVNILPNRMSNVARSFACYCLVRASCPSQASFLALLTDRRSLVEDPAFQDNMRAFHARCGEIYIMLLVAQIYLSKTATFCRYIERPADAICPSFCAYFLPIFVGLNPILWHQDVPGFKEGSLVVKDFLCLARMFFDICQRQSNPFNFGKTMSIARIEASSRSVENGLGIIPIS